MKAVSDNVFLTANQQNKILAKAKRMGAKVYAIVALESLSLPIRKVMIPRTYCFGGNGF